MSVKEVDICSLKISNEIKNLSRPDGFSLWFNEDDELYIAMYSGRYFDISVEFDYATYDDARILSFIDNIKRAENGENISWDKFHLSVFEHDIYYHENIGNMTEAEENKSDEMDMVNHPSHYTASERGVECIDAIYACLDSYKDNPTIAWLCGQVIKYIWRAPLKGKFSEDLKKAQFYMNEVIKELK